MPYLSFDNKIVVGLAQYQDVLNILLCLSNCNSSQVNTLLVRVLIYHSTTQMIRQTKYLILIAQREIETQQVNVANQNSSLQCNCK